MAYSMDLRLRVVAALERGECVSDVARQFSVSRTAARDWRDRASAGCLEPGVPGPKDSVKLTEADDQIMREQVAACPGITAKQLQPMLSVEVVISTVCRRLKKLGLRLKKSR